MQGLLLINKSENKTSYGAVGYVKRITGERRVGHTGTLDPMATGVLPVFLGRATALSSYLLEANKEYIAKIRLGTVTDTCDITGKILQNNIVSVTNEDVIDVLKKFVGKQKQIPPMYSAVKKDGIRMYTLAREGKTVDIPPRDIEIFSIIQTSPLDSNNEFVIKTNVSKGTYIRSLCRDIGNMLGCGATLTALCRTYASGFGIENCIDLEKLNSENVKEYILSEEKAVEYLPEIFVTEKQAVRFCNGGQLAFDRLKNCDFKDRELYRIKFEDTFVGIGTADIMNRQMAIKCIINDVR